MIREKQPERGAAKMWEEGFGSPKAQGISYSPCSYVCSVSSCSTPFFCKLFAATAMPGSGLPELNVPPPATSTDAASRHPLLHPGESPLCLIIQRYLALSLLCRITTSSSDLLVVEVVVVVVSMHKFPGQGSNFNNQSHSRDNARPLTH